MTAAVSELGDAATAACAEPGGGNEDESGAEGAPEKREEKREDASVLSCPAAQPTTHYHHALQRQDPSKIVVRNTFIDVTSNPSAPSSPVIRSCPPTAMLPHARPVLLASALPKLRQLEAAVEARRRSPPLAAASKLPTTASGQTLEQLTPTQSTASPGSRPLEEVWNSPLRAFDSALSGPQAPPWNPDLIGELVANAAAVLETHTPALSSASPAAQPLEALPLISPPYTPSWPPSEQPRPLVLASPPRQSATPGAGPDAAAMACSFAAISSFAAIDELEEECGGPDGVMRGAALNGECWWRALEEPTQPPSPPESVAEPKAQTVDVPSSESGMKPIPSLGSKGHYRRHCKPCAFLYTKGCSNGFECEFCHLCEAGEKKRRSKERQEKRRHNNIGKWQRGYAEMDVMKGRQDGVRMGSVVQVQASDVQPVLPVGPVFRTTGTIVETTSATGPTGFPLPR